MHVDRSTDGEGLRGNQCIFKHGDSEVSFRHARRHCLSAGGMWILELRRVVQRERNISVLPTHSDIYDEIRWIHQASHCR